MLKRVALLSILALLLAACAMAEGEALLHLTFDEGAGSAVADVSGHLPEGAVEYQYLHAAYTDSMEPEWRDAGIEGGCLLFDGCSTCVSYPKGTLSLGGEALTISAWVAPRAFEWDDPEAAERGEAHLTSILGQYSKAAGQGVLLGYQRFGRLCFEVGASDGWHTLWAEDARLQRLAWNHVCAVFDGEQGEMRLYLNGEIAGALAVAPGSAILPAENEALLVGRNAYAERIGAGSYNWFAGLMDELWIEQDALDGEAVMERAALDAPEIPYGDIGLENILTGDFYKTQYHGGPYQHWMNEPHAPLYYNGAYHLFFQSNSIGTYWRNICWGHLVSEDTVRWRPVKDAIVPTEGSVVPDGVWSGGATLDKNGVPVLFFTAGNDSFRKDGLISNQNIGAAWPADLTDPELTDWVIADRLAVAQQEGQGRPGEFRDPHIWREGDDWYMLVCSGSAETTGGTALLYVTDRLEVLEDGIDMDWRYVGPVYEMESQSATYGTSWELPILLPLSNRAGTVTRYAFFISPAPAGLADNKVYYFVGDFDRETGKFTPDSAMNGVPRMLDYGNNVFTGPSALVDPATGRVCMFSIMQDKRDGAEEAAAGWAHCVGLTHNLYLSDDGADICVEPDPRVYGLLGDLLAGAEHATVEQANAALAKIDGDMLFIRAVLKPGNCERFGFTVKSNGKRDETTFTYAMTGQTVSGYTSNKGAAASAMVIDGSLPLADGKLTMEVFVDRSLVEAFFNSDKSLCVRAYGKKKSRQMFLFAEGALEVERLEVYGVDSIY